MLRKLLIGLLIAVAVATLVGLVMPTQWRVERTTEISATPAEVFVLIEDLQRWPEWTAWNEASDPTLERRFGAGKSAGVGAMMAWTGEAVGEGLLEISESVPGRKIAYELRLEQDGLLSRGTISLAPVQGGVRVTWSTEGELGWSPLVRLMGPWIERAVGSDFDRGLVGLKRAAEGRRGV